MSWSWRKALGIPEPVASPAPPPERPRPLNITQAELARSRRASDPLIPAEQVYKPLAPMPGVAPEMAMDNALTATTNWAMQAVLASNLHEGIGFLGYPYLAQLAQRVEYRHACEIWAEHATRKWIKLRGDDEKVKAIDAEFRRLDVRGVFQDAALTDHLFGRSQIFLDFGDFDDPRELAAELMVDQRKVSAKRPVKRLKVIEPMWSYPAPYDTTNPLNPDFYRPRSWYVFGKQVSDTRLLTIVGRDVPDMLKPAYAFGGQSLTMLMKAYVDNWLRTRQSVSDLLHSFSVMVLGTDMTAMLQVGAATDVATRAAYFNNYRDNQGLMIVDKATEALTNVAAPIAGLEGLQAQAQEQLASAARIPLSIYLQITPTGLNASSDGEIRSFYADVHGYQEKNFRPPLQRVLEIVQLSLFGAIDPEIGFDFEPLWEMSATDAAQIRKSDAEADTAYINAGVVDAEETRDRLRNDQTSLYHGVELKEGAPEDDGEGDDDDNQAGQNGGRDEDDADDGAASRDGR